MGILLWQAVGVILILKMTLLFMASLPFGVGTNTFAALMVLKEGMLYCLQIGFSDVIFDVL